MILRTLAFIAIVAICATVATAFMVLAYLVLHPIIVWIASDGRTAWGCAAAMVIVGLVFVMEGNNRNGTR